MIRCATCGKRDRGTAYYCPDCSRWHGRDHCRSTRFNDALAWCWCGASTRASGMSRPVRLAIGGGNASP